MQKALLAALLACLPLASFASDVEVDLGKRDDIAKLFSYPNCQQNCPAPAPSLEMTVSHWLMQNTLRDASATNAKVAPAVEVRNDSDHIKATIRNAPADDYGTVIQSYLAIGQLGYQGAQAVQQAGIWQSDWRFFLTLGMAMRNHRTVQLLHFPPDTVLNDSQDYLTAATTLRWAQVLGYNGMNVRDNGLYQTIADIAPIAAPASAGSALTGTYSYFSQYTAALLNSWTAPAPGGSTVRPMVALGGPARAWFAQQYLPEGSKFDVLQLAKVDIGNNKQVPVLGGNHPSYIWYAGSDQEGIAIMGQDLEVACWQNTMGQKPDGDAQGVLDSCKTTWQNDSNMVCRLYYTSIKNMSAADAKAKCS
ncbi:hypothetical protein [Vogesella sp. LIG4]|uniref:hypothetical protein n=1 Tax=Vogesella sp. LIG4 TaxID=1192162 RepID=UPI00081FDDBE|nr:hypothetical protein [Vogesella sp. LIG4]SCK30713.1 hypothetical protein PSELUDRAFT_3823 [Vogesella sp. LIG4]